MKMNDANGDILIARFKQMGAHELTNIASRLYYIVFKITEAVEVTYVYNINKKEQYFLQRISPYPLPKGLFNSQEEIITFIERDLEKFRNAAQSSNFQHFLEFNRHLTQIENDVERLFLNYNVPKAHLEEFNHLLNQLTHEVRAAKNRSTHIVIQR